MKEVGEGSQQREQPEQRKGKVGATVGIWELSMEEVDNAMEEARNEVCSRRSLPFLSANVPQFLPLP